MRKTALAILAALLAITVVSAANIPLYNGPQDVPSLLNYLNGLTNQVNGQLTAITPSYSGGTKPFRSGPVVTCVGDSECISGTTDVPNTAAYPSTAGYQVGTYSNGILGWLQSVSGGALALDFATDAYPGNYYGLAYMDIVTQGTGCPANTTVVVTPATPVTAPIHSPTPLTFTTDANGNTPVAGYRMIEPTSVAQGSGYTNLPTPTISVTCSTPPTFGWALTGVGAFGVNSEQTAAWLIRINNEVCAAKPDWAIILIGTNDLATGVAEATINANTLAGLQAMEACGIRPVLMGIGPRTIGVNGWTQTLDRARLRINAWRRNLSTLTQQGLIASTTGTPAYPNLPYPVFYVDADHYWSDPSQSGATAGNPFGSVVLDGLHQSSLGAFEEALTIWAEISPFVRPATRFVPNSQNDVYDATNNPAGNLLGTVGLFLGTSGVANAPCTTTSGVATGWTVYEFGNAAMSCVGTLETARTDGLAGVRQVETISDSSGTAADSVTLANTTNISANFSAGDQVYLEGDIDISNMTNVGGFGCYFQEYNTVNQQTIQTNVGTPSSYTGYPGFASATIAKWFEAANLPDWDITAGGLLLGSFRVHIHTPPITVQTGDTNTYTNCVVYLDGALGATATVKFGNMAIRKANAN